MRISFLLSFSLSMSCTSIHIVNVLASFTMCLVVELVFLTGGEQRILKKKKVIANSWLRQFPVYFQLPFDLMLSYCL